MEGLSYAESLKSLSPFSLERRRRRLPGIFAVWEHLKGDHKDSGQELIRLRNGKNNPQTLLAGCPPIPRARWAGPGS